MLHCPLHVCYTLQIKLEDVILRLQMIQCNPTYDDSTGRVRVMKLPFNFFFAVSGDPRQELCIVFNKLFTRCQAEGNVRPLLTVHLNLIFSCTLCVLKIGTADIIESP
jgi:hypothetical protein